MAGHQKFHSAGWHQINSRSGWVSSFQIAIEILEKYYEQNGMEFVSGKKEKTFNVDAEPRKNSRIYFRDKTGVIPFDGTAFVFIGLMTKECVFGRQKHKTKADQSTEKGSSSKKNGCEARIVLKEVVRFPKYKAVKNTERHRRDVSRQLRADGALDKHKTERRFYINFPDNNSHSKHPNSQLTVNTRERDMREENMTEEKLRYVKGRMCRKLCDWIKEKVDDCQNIETLNKKLKDVHNFLKDNLITKGLDDTADSSRPPVEESLEKVKSWKNKITNEKWITMIKQSILSQNIADDYIHEAGLAAAAGLETVTLEAIQMMAPPSLHGNAKSRLMNIILHSLVNDGVLTTEVTNDAAADDLSVNDGLIMDSTDDAAADDISGTEVFPIGGLPNHAGSNICFCNVVLQCLKTTDICKILKFHQLCDPACFLCELANFYNTCPSSSQGICKKMQDVWPAYNFGSQQDAHEMLQLILNQLQRIADGKSLYERTFEGHIESTVKCGQCGTRSSRSEVFNNISVSMKNCVSLRQSVKRFFGAEEIKDFKCASCQKSGTASKQNYITKLPRTVIVNLKRFEMGEGMWKKYFNVEKHVFLRNYIKEGLLNDVEYIGRLTSFIVHHGSPNKGHYLCYVRRDKLWYRLNDEEVSEIQMTKEILREAYIMFFKMLPKY